MSAKAETMLDADEVTEALELCRSGNHASKLLLRRHIDALTARLQRAEADNAALKERAEEALSIATELRPAVVRQTNASAALSELMEKPHPGAAILERLAKAEKALSEEWNRALDAAEKEADSEIEYSEDGKRMNEQTGRKDTASAYSARIVAATGIKEGISALKRPTP